MNLPAGYTLRSFTFRDVPVVVDLWRAYSTAIFGFPRDTVEDLTADWQEMGFTPETDSIGVFAPDGQLVGYGDVFNLRPPFIRLSTSACVRPGYTGQGIGAFLLEWIETRARQVIPLAKPELRVDLEQFIYGPDSAAAELLKSRGFTFLRRHMHMQMELDAILPPPPLPNGITIHPIQPVEAEMRAFAHTQQEAFLDLWGAVPEPFEQYYTHWSKAVLQSPGNDIDLWVAAWDGDQIIGTSLGSLRRPEDPALGWIGSVGVLRPYRRQGIAQALVSVTCERLKQKGMLRAGLYVDSASPSGASRVYERVGMRVRITFDRYAKELRPGEDISHRA